MKKILAGGSLLLAAGVGWYLYRKIKEPQETDAETEKNMKPKIGTVDDVFSSEPDKPSASTIENMKKDLKGKTIKEGVDELLNNLL